MGSIRDAAGRQGERLEARAETLRQLSRELISEGDVDALHEKLLDAAVELMGADFGSMQLLDRERENGAELRLLAHRGFGEEAARAWEWIGLDSQTACGRALRTNARVVDEDVELSPHLSATERARFRETGIRSCQTTPLVSRGGHVVGMISTHWREPHRPGEDELRLLDVLARQAADLLERTRTEASRDESEQRYRALFNSIDQGFCTIDLAFDEEDRVIDCRFVEVSPSFERQTGIENGVGRWMREIATDFDERWFELYGRVSLTGEPVRFEDHSTPLGRWWSVYAFRVEDRPRGRVGILLDDITARKTAQAALAVAARRDAFLVELNDALRSLDDPRAIKHEAARVLGERLNANRAAYFETDGDEYVVESDYTRGVPSLAGRHPVESLGLAALERHREGVTSVVPDIALAPGGAERRSLAAIEVGAYVTVPLVKEGRFVAGLTVHSARPRTWTPTVVSLVEETAERTWAAVERARAEAALARSEERLRLALDSSGMGSFIWHPEEDEGEPDEQMLALFGLPPDSTLNLASALATMIHPDDAEPYAAAVAKALDPAGTGELRGEIRVRHPDGTERWLAVTGRTFFEGKPLRATRLAGTAVDITERKRAEAALSSAAKDRERRERLQREFVANAAHELRTPLTAILGAVEALQGGAKDDPVVRERFLAHVEREGSRLARLSESLLLLAQADSAAGLQQERFKVRDLLDDVASGLDVRAGVAVEVRGPKTLELESSRGLVERVIANLAENAAKHTREGCIVLSAGATATGVEISVRDTGVGLSAVDSDRAFDRFYRGGVRTADGFGLGLSIARQATLAIGGTLELEPARGGGTLATLVVPSA